MSKSELEILFINIFDLFVRSHKIPPISYEREYHFAAEHVGTGPGVRNRLKAAGLCDWRFDFAFLLGDSGNVAVEIDGGTHMVRWSPKLKKHVVVGHHSKSGDYAKINAATRLGWKVLRFTGTMLKKNPTRCMYDLAACLGFGFESEM